MAMAALAGILIFNSGAGAQPTAAPAENAAPTADNAILLTVFLKHDQSRPLSELNAQLEKQGFYKAFPPPGVEVVSWYIMMGIGQSRHAAAAGLPAPRDQSRAGKHRLGQLSHGVLSDLRLQGDRPRGA
jgi:hypothetical protein